MDTPKDARRSGRLDEQAGVVFREPFLRVETKRFRPERALGAHAAQRPSFKGPAATAVASAVLSVFEGGACR